MELRARQIHDIAFDEGGLQLATDQGLWVDEALVATCAVLGLALRSDGTTAYLRSDSVGHYVRGVGASEHPLAAPLRKIHAASFATVVMAEQGFYLWYPDTPIESMTYVNVGGEPRDLQESGGGLMVLHGDSVSYYSPSGSFQEQLPIPAGSKLLAGPDYPGVLFDDGSFLTLTFDPMASGDLYPSEGFVNRTLELANYNALLLVGSRGPLLDGAWTFDHDLSAFMDAPWACDNAQEIGAVFLRGSYLAYADSSALFVVDLSLGKIINRIPVLPPEDLLPRSLMGMWQSEPIALNGVAEWLEVEVDSTGWASGSVVELRAMAYRESRWQPWQTPDRFVKQRPGDQIQLRVRLESPDGKQHATVAGVTLRYSDANRNLRERYLPLWDYQLVDRKLRTDFLASIDLDEERSYLKPARTNLTFDLRASLESYPLDLVADARDMDSARLPSELAHTRALFYADRRVVETELDDFPKILRGRLTEPALLLGVAINRLPYSQATETMARGFPEWMTIRSDTDSEGQKFLNLLALEFEEVREQLRVLSSGRYLATAADEPSQIGIVQTESGANLLPDYPWKLVPDLQSFYYNLDTPVVYQDPVSGVAYVSLSHAPFSANGKEYRLADGGLKILDLYNSLDTFGDLLNLKRLPEETNARYFDRLADVFASPANPTRDGMTNALSRELGIPRAWVGVHQLGSRSFMAQLIDDRGIPTERLRRYVKLIHSQALIRWGFFRWDESFWLDDNSEAYLPNVFDPILPARKSY